MADNTSTEAAKGRRHRRIVRIVGAVVDVEFPADAMPAIYNALTVKAQTQRVKCPPCSRCRRTCPVTSSVPSL